MEQQRDKRVYYQQTYFRTIRERGGLVMKNKDLVKMVKGWGLPAKLISDRWVETKIDDSQLLLSIDKIEGNLYCMIVVHKLHSQTVYQQIIRGIKSLGFKSPAYTSGIYWECTDITENTFFKKRGDAKTLQLLTDKIVASLTAEINKIIKSWGN